MHGTVSDQLSSIMAEAPEPFLRGQGSTRHAQSVFAAFFLDTQAVGWKRARRPGADRSRPHALTVSVELQFPGGRVYDVTSSIPQGQPGASGRPERAVLLGLGRVEIVQLMFALPFLP